MSIKLRPLQGVIVIPTYVDNRKDVSNTLHRVLTEYPIVQANNPNGEYLMQTLGLTVGELVFHDQIAKIEQKIEAVGLIKHEEDVKQMLLHCVYHGCGFIVEKE